MRFVVQIIANWNYKNRSCIAWSKFPDQLLIKSGWNLIEWEFMLGISSFKVFQFPRADRLAFIAHSFHCAEHQQAPICHEPGCRRTVLVQREEVRKEHVAPFEIRECLLEPYQRRVWELRVSIRAFNERVQVR